MNEDIRGTLAENDLVIRGASPSEIIQTSVQSDWTETDIDSGAYIKHKPTIPTASNTTPKMDGTAAVGTEARFARGDHVHPSDTTRVPKTTTINGHALSSNVTITANDIGVESGAEVNVLEGVKLNGTDLPITNKKVDLVPFTPTIGSQSGTPGIVPAPGSNVSTYGLLTSKGEWARGEIRLGSTSGTPVRGALSGDYYRFTLPNANENTSGLMAPADKTKLDSVESNAEENVLEGVKVDGTDLPITNKKTEIPKARRQYGVVRVDEVGSDGAHSQMKLMDGTDTWTVPTMTSNDGSGTIRPHLLPQATHDVWGAVQVFEWTDHHGMVKGGSKTFYFPTIDSETGKIDPAFVPGGGGGGGGDYVLTYDPLSSVGSAEIGEAVTGTPNYTPAGEIQYTTKNVSAKANVRVNYSTSDCHFYFYGIDATVNNIPIPDQFTFNGTGVTFAIQEEE